VTLPLRGVCNEEGCIGSARETLLIPTRRGGHSRYNLLNEPREKPGYGICKQRLDRPARWVGGRTETEGRPKVRFGRCRATVLPRSPDAPLQAPFPGRKRPRVQGITGHLTRWFRSPGRARNAAARVTPPLREPVGSFSKPLEAGDRSRVGLCADYHTRRVPRGGEGDEGARGCGLGVNRRLGHLRAAVRSTAEYETGG
jgi:hypothetical protein